MGTYDTYGNVQIKTGPRGQIEYSIGDHVLIPDGIYVGWEGAVVILEGLFIGVFPLVYDKWGRVHGTSDLLIQRREPRYERG